MAGARIKDKVCGCCIGDCQVRGLTGPRTRRPLRPRPPLACPCPAPTDAPDQARVHQLFHGGPGLPAVGLQRGADFVGHGPVDLRKAGRAVGSGVKPQVSGIGIQGSGHRGRGQWAVGLGLRFQAGQRAVA